MTSRNSTIDNRTTQKRLHGIAYRILEDEYDIHDFINTEVRRELETDFESMGLDLSGDIVVDSLPKRKWRLDIVNLNEVQLNPVVMDSVDRNTGRKFVERLSERRSELRRVIEKGGTPIWPLVLLGEGLFLLDGYCRLSTLKEMEIPRAYAYTGHLVTKQTNSSRVQRRG